MTQADDHLADCVDEDDCPNCGGEGVIYDCLDGFCEDAESGCELCERRCDWCSPVKAAKE